MHEIPTETSIGSVDVSRATKSGVRPSGTDPISVSPPVSSPFAPILAIYGPSLGLLAASEKVSISFVKAQALGLLRHFPPSHPQPIVCPGWINPPSCSTRLTIPTPNSARMNPKLVAEFDALQYLVHETYHVCLSVFSKREGTTFPLCRPYDNRIDPEDDTSPLPGPTHSLCKVEWLALRSFLDENLANKFIRPSVSHGAPIHFIKKRDSSLRLAVGYYDLNRVTKNDRSAPAHSRLA